MRAVIYTNRLRLVALDAEALQSLLAGTQDLGGASIPAWWPHGDPGEAAMLGSFADRLRDAPDLFVWRLRMMVALDSRRMIGHIGFHDPPRDGQLELGYTVFEPYRRQGYASEAIRALMDAAALDDDIHRFRLAISPTNTASTTLAEAMGFVSVGEQIDDDDGLEVVFERSWPASDT